MRRAGFAGRCLGRCKTSCRSAPREPSVALPRKCLLAPMPGSAIWAMARTSAIGVFAWLCSLGVTPMAIADVIVLKNGGQLKGKVAEQGENYLLVRPDGSRMTIPKTIVKEFTQSEDGAEAPPAKAAVETVREALKGSFERVQAIRKVVSQSLEQCIGEERARFEEVWQDYADRKDLEAVKQSQSSLDLLKLAIKELGKMTRSPADVTLTTPDGQKKRFVVSPSNKQAVLERFTKYVRDAQSRAEANARRNMMVKGDLKADAQYRGLLEKIDKVERALELAVKEAARLHKDEPAVKTKLAAAE